MFAAEHISFGYVEESRVFDDLSFSIQKGEIACLLGPNGAGKTTLLKCLLGIYKVRTGYIKIKNRKLDLVAAKDLACAMAYVPQATTSVFPHKVIDIAVMGRTPHVGFNAVPTQKDYCMAEAALEELGISHLANRQFSQISGGERQLTLIARALTQQAELLIMDEPTSSLDYGNQVRILRVIAKLAKQGYSILMTSHFPNHAFLLCNKVVMMKNGKITAMGTPQEVVTEQNLSDLYRTKVKIVEVDNGNEGKLQICVPLLD